MRYKYVIYDWNGTLLDDTVMCHSILNSLLSERGKPTISFEHYRDIFTFPIKNYYIKAGFDFSSESYESIAEKYVPLFNSKCRECKLAEGAEEMLEACSRAGIIQMVLSATEQNMLVSQLKQFGINNYFVSALGLGDPYARSKVELGTKELVEKNINPKDVVMIGDTEHDYDVAKAIGCDIILYSEGHQPYERLIKLTDKIFTNFGDIMKFVLMTNDE